MMIKNVKTIMTWLVLSPSDFRKDWRMELYNQVCHFFLGALTAIVAASLFYFLYDEYPEKELLSLFCVTSYFVFIELLFQKWSGHDTVVDLMFVSLGVFSTSYGLDEKIIQEQVVLKPNFLALGVIFSVFAFTLLAHILKRLSDEHNSG